MECEKVKERLLLHQSELNDAGIVHIFLHGSVARGESTPSSDVDLIADLSRSKRFTLFDLAGLEARLSDILEKPVDLSDRRMLKEEVRVRAERDALLVF
jgi:predicted nucleotidyltransferase